MLCKMTHQAVGRAHCSHFKQMLVLEDVSIGLHTYQHMRTGCHLIAHAIDFSDIVFVGGQLIEHVELDAVRNISIVVAEVGCIQWQCDLILYPALTVGYDMYLAIESLCHQTAYAQSESCLRNVLLEVFDSSLVLGASHRDQQALLALHRIVHDQAAVACIVHLCLDNILEQKVEQIDIDLYHVRIIHVREIQFQVSCQIDREYLLQLCKMLPERDTTDMVLDRWFFLSYHRLYPQHKIGNPCSLLLDVVELEQALLFQFLVIVHDDTVGIGSESADEGKHLLHDAREIRGLVHLFLQVSVLAGHQLLLYPDSLVDVDRHSAEVSRTTILIAFQGLSPETIPLVLTVEIETKVDLKHAVTLIDR